uniref:Serpentine receptor class gamma n=1 Tax=Steinernema glaseri TaxID=37863 RepID=A0A1I7ZR05_9BILA
MKEHNDATKILVYYLLSGVTILFAIPFFYILIFHSTSTLRLYRNTILNLTIWYLLAVETNGVFLQILFSMDESKLCARYVGLASHIGHKTTIVCLFLCIIPCANAGVSVFICFLYRYVQISGRTLPARISWVSPTAMCVGLYATSSFIAGYMMYLFVSGAYVSEVDGILHVCFDERNYSTVATVNIVIIGAIALGGVAVLSLVFMTIRSLRSHRAFMTKQTYRLQLLLTVNLMAPFLDAISMCIATVVFVTPYRKAARKMFWRKLTVTPT